MVHTWLQFSDRLSGRQLAKKTSTVRVIQLLFNFQPHLCADAPELLDGLDIWARSVLVLLEARLLLLLQWWSFNLAKSRYIGIV